MTSHKKTKTYRFLEMAPALATWLTFAGAAVLSYLTPTVVAFYIILFDLYWVLKAINTAMHLLSSFIKLRLHARYDWWQRCSMLLDIEDYKRQLRRDIMTGASRRSRNDLKQELVRLDRLDFSHRLHDFRKIYHLVILPTYKESLTVLDSSIRSILDSDFPTKQIFFVLATEERDRLRAEDHSEILRQRYGDKFFRFETVMHPDGLPGEIKAKGANLTYAGRFALKAVGELKISIDHVIVSAFDSDTVVSSNYFSYLTYAFLTAEKPHRTSYQPMPVYNNNIWDAPAITRIVAIANSFWQMVEASRPDRLVTFSSHALSLRALVEVDFWPVDVISDDSQIFWRCWLHYHGDYRTIPIFTTVSLDAMLDVTYVKTLIGQYKQKRRWAWGNSENIPYLVTNSVHDHLIPWWKKLIYIERMVEGYYFWATASIMIASLGWLPLILGGDRLVGSVLLFNLPFLTRFMMQVATVFLIFSVYINLVMIPPRPKNYSRWRTFNMVLQWVFVPVVSIFFGSAPAIDAQTRMMFGRYLGFWVTPKTRLGRIENPALIFQKERKRDV